MPGASRVRGGIGGAWRSEEDAIVETRVCGRQMGHAGKDSMG